MSALNLAALNMMQMFQHPLPPNLDNKNDHELIILAIERISNLTITVRIQTLTLIGLSAGLFIFGGIAVINFLALYAVVTIFHL